GRSFSMYAVSFSSLARRMPHGRRGHPPRDPTHRRKTIHTHTHTHTHTSSTTCIHPRTRAPACGRVILPACIFRCGIRGPVSSAFCTLCGGACVTPSSITVLSAVSIVDPLQWYSSLVLKKIRMSSNILYRIG